MVGLPNWHAQECVISKTITRTLYSPPFCRIRFLRHTLFLSLKRTLTTSNVVPKARHDRYPTRTLPRLPNDQKMQNKRGKNKCTTVAPHSKRQRKKRHHGLSFPRNKHTPGTNKTQEKDDETNKFIHKHETHHTKRTASVLVFTSSDISWIIRRSRSFSESSSSTTSPDCSAPATALALSRTSAAVAAAAIPAAAVATPIDALLAARPAVAACTGLALIVSVEGAVGAKAGYS